MFDIFDLVFKFERVRELKQMGCEMGLELLLRMEKLYIVVLGQIKVDFDWYLRFMCEGLWSVVRVLSDNCLVKYDILVEMLCLGSQDER